MKINTFIVLTSTVILGTGAVVIGESSAEKIRQRASTLVEEARLEGLVEHFKNITAEQLKLELEHGFLSALAQTEHAPEDLSGQLARIKIRTRVLRQAVDQTGAMIMELAAELAEKVGTVQPSTEPEAAGGSIGNHVEWHGSATDDEALYMTLALAGETGRFVIEERENRLAGTVTILPDNKCNFAVTEGSGGMGEEYVGKTARGIYRETSEGLALVLNAPGDPSRPTKMEAEGDVKGFFLRHK